MKKILFLFTLSCALVISTFGQSAIVPVGGTASGSGGSATYTIGQPAIQRVQNGGTYIIEGVQQPYEIQTVGVDNHPGITLEAIVYPNPTRNVVHLRIRNYEIPAEGLTAQLYDNNGKLLRMFDVTELETEIDMNTYPSATYQLRVLDGKSLLKTFKVVKNR